MNYYRISFNRITTPDDTRPLYRHWDWYDLICQAQNYDEAREHGLRVAEDRNVNYCCVMRLTRIEGAALITREHAFQEIPGKAPQ